MKFQNELLVVSFSDGTQAYIVKRFDKLDDGSKLAQEDFASLDHRTPQTHGENYKYLGNYSELFDIMKKIVSAYSVEAPKLLKLILFNYLFSNGDAHIKNFSLLESPMGDYKLSPAYDLLNTRLHIADRDFALEDGLLPRSIAKGKVHEQFIKLGKISGIKNEHITKIFTSITSKKEEVLRYINRSFLSTSLKRNYEQAYLTKLKKLLR